jgi:hypothetical protein
MYRLISRRILALAVAYALALAPVLPLLTAFARAGDVGSADLAPLCASGEVGGRSAADVPNGHGPLCPFGVGCSMQGCGGADNGVLPAATGVVEILAFGAAPSLIRLAGETPLLRAGGAHPARAPPRA